MVTRHGAHGLVSVSYLTASTHYNSGALIPEYQSVSHIYYPLMWLIMCLVTGVCVCKALNIL